MTKVDFFHFVKYDHLWKQRTFQCWAFQTPRSPHWISIWETSTSVIRYKMASYLSALGLILIITLMLSVVHHSGASWGWGCRGPKNERTRFGKPKRMWWYNSETDQCEAFTYLGSGGNANRHPWVNIANIKLQTFKTSEQGNEWDLVLGRHLARWLGIWTRWRFWWALRKIFEC